MPMEVARARSLSRTFPGDCAPQIGGLSPSPGLREKYCGNNRELCGALLARERFANSLHHQFDGDALIAALGDDHISKPA